MKYLFTTLAVGKPYVDNAILFYQELSEKTNFCDFNITTNQENKNFDKINFDYFTLYRYNDNMAGFSFFLNLKSLSLKYALNKNYDYVIFTDADWRITENFSESNLLNMFKHMEDKNYDFLFERPAEIGYYKNRPNECFFQQKLNDFNVYEHDLWDKAHCVNEQFLVFKVNWKFKMFVMKWEMFLWYSIANNIRSYPDGFDIGVSALESNMKYDFSGWQNFIRNCFHFNDKQNTKHIRF
jgi:hypothetical protein